VTWDSLRVRVNDFAIRCFRDSGDRDYITARMAFRAGLMPQFLWSGLQAIEKYFKCIHVLNRVPKPPTPLRHNLAASYELMRKCPFKVRLSETTTEIIKHLDDYGEYRYLEISWHVLGHERFRLDRAVWEIRRYCRPFDNSTLALDIAKIEASETRPPHQFQLQGGLLEKILTNRKHPARSALVWQNHYFSSRSRKRVRVGGLHAENSPLWLYPEMLDEVCKYAYLPKPVIIAYREQLAKRKRDGTARTLLP